MSSHLAMITLALAGCMSQASAVLIGFETTSGYQVGNLYNQPGTAGATKWGAIPNAINNNLLSVTSGAGVGGSQAIVAQANATVAAGVYQYVPTSTDLGGVFSNASSQIAFSFQLKWDSLGPSGTYTGRFFVGNTLSTQAGDVLRLSWGANGQLIYTLSDTTVRFATNAGGMNFAAAAGSFYTVSGVLDYATKSYTLSVNGVQQTDNLGSSNISFVNAAGANVNSNFEIQTQLNNSANFRPWTLDNLNYALVPEPSAVALALLAGGMLILVRRARGKVQSS
jgi:hypothetical protein